MAGRPSRSTRSVNVSYTEPTEDDYLKGLRSTSRPSASVSASLSAATSAQAASTRIKPIKFNLKALRQGLPKEEHLDRPFHDEDDNNHDEGEDNYNEDEYNEADDNHDDEPDTMNPNLNPFNARRSSRTSRRSSAGSSQNNLKTNGNSNPLATRTSSRRTRATIQQENVEENGMVYEDADGQGRSQAQLQVQSGSRAPGRRSSRGYNPNLDPELGVPLHEDGDGEEDASGEVDEEYVGDGDGAENMDAVPEEEEEEEEVGKFSSDSRRFRLRSRGLSNGQRARGYGQRYSHRVSPGRFWSVFEGHDWPFDITLLDPRFRTRG